MLDQIVIDEAVQALRPDFAVLLMTAEGLANGPSDGRTGDVTPSEGVDGGHVEAWREAYRGFGVNPKRARPSVDALLRRGDLPEINRVVDAYNVVSVRFELPIGGEDLDAYDGPARLVRATGDEPFDTVKNGEAVVEHPEPGEVIWRDGTGVTCRRWNWRQARRTQLGDDTTAGLFIFDALDPMTDDALHAAAEDLVVHLARHGPDVRVHRRLIAAGPALD
jgi:DNA/RNA-binding domain of Phe-tRNA-synthetase-like protein